MKKIPLLSILFLSLTAAVSAQVLENAALIFPGLETGAGPKALAMGEAFTAIADDASAIYWNPAGMAQLERACISGTFDKWFDDTFYDYFTGAIPFKNGGGLGFTASYMNLGKFDKIDALGVKTGEFSSYIFLASLGYAQKFGDNFTVGISGKVLVQDLSVSMGAGCAADIGMLLKFGQFSAGLTGQNIGTGGDYPLPVIIKGGIACRVLDTSTQSLVLACDARAILKDTVYCMFGAEYGIAKVFYLRAGYELSAAEKTLDGITGLSAGIGLNFMPIQLDYAIVPFGGLGTTHRMSVSLNFAEAAKKQIPVGTKRVVTQDDIIKANELYKEGVAFETEKNYKDAAAKYTASLRLNNTDAKVWKRLGIAHYRAGNKEAAMKALDSALYLDPADTKLKAFLEKNRK